MNTTTRNATLQDLATMLQDQQGRKVDMIVPATKLWSQDARILVEGTGTDTILTPEGVTTVPSGDGVYVPTAVFDEGLSAKLGIPLAYVRRMREERPDLYDANVNGWLYGGEPIDGNKYAGPDQRSFMLRGFRGDNGPGIARALLSDKYRRMDNLDCLTAALTGVQEAGVAVNIQSADLTDRRMVVRVVCEEVKAVATELLRGYRSPFTGLSGTDNPVMFAGFEISNSETGGGAFTITPRAVVQVCSNGMKITKDAARSRHVGGRLEEGVIDWSEDTQAKQLAVITAQARDAVKQFLNVEYLERTVVRLTEQAGKPIEKPEAEVKQLTKGLGFTEDQQEAVLGFFIRGGQVNLGGVVNAITAYAQEVPDGDAAYDLETKATSLLGV